MLTEEELKKLPEWIRLSFAANVLGIDQTNVTAMIKRGSIAHQKIGKAVLVSRDDILLHRAWRLRRKRIKAEPSQHDV